MSSRVDSSLDCLAVVPHEAADGATVLRATGFLEPRHLVALAATAHRLAGAAPDSRVLLDVPDAEAASYAARMHLGTTLRRLGCRHRLPAVGERRRSDRLLEVTEVAGPDEVLRLGGLVRHRLRGREADVVTALFDAVTELGANVHDHADAGVRHRAGGFMAAQTMPRRHEIVFAIADDGVGMLATLRRRGADDDTAAITLALDGTSRFVRPTRGLGVSTTARLVTALGGSLYVASGAASVTVGGGRTRRARLATPYAGTLLQARVPMA